MSDTNTTELAVAVRMTCAKVEGSGEVTVPPRVSLRESADPADVSCPADTGAAGVANAVADYIREAGSLPGAVAVEGVGVFCVKPSRSGRLAGTVAVVTGSAQGFGKGIAEAMAAEGADVVVADLNTELGEAAAAELNAAHGEDCAVFCEADVTDSASMTACVDAAVRRFGGVDLFIANAGVLKAGGLEEMTERDFDFVTAVNYKGYFLCVQAVARVMKLQHRYHGDWMMDIIQISSKSGLVGSNRNFAYAGSKFGAIGLTQSFALELMDENIKVNSVCPGNYYEGPLWSDPKNGLFVQYLEAGKVPGAANLEDVRAYYTSRVPMKRGCTPRDVAIAIFYLREQTYETGQALPVAGGEVMLK